MDGKYKRVNVLIRPEQHDWVHQERISLSGLIRDLLDDRYSDTKIVLSVSRETHKVYDKVISNFGAGDGELERFFRKALVEFLAERKSQLDNLQVELDPDDEVPHEKGSVKSNKRKS